MNINHSQAAFLIILLVIAQGSSLKAIDGGYSEWSKFSECNATCGGGIMVRKRSCNNPEPQHGGKNCKGLGTAVEEKNCNSFPCPLDGGYSHWSNFTSCSVTCGGGEQTRIRSCTNPVPCCGGRNCEHLGPSVETRKCNTCKCVIDGGYSEWCSFTACSVTCGGGVSYRTRTCTGPPPENGGRSCDSLGPDIETQECNTEECPIDGNFTKWGNWSECSATCGDGLRIRTRTCILPSPQYGGKNCSELGLTETQGCNPYPCSIDGNYSKWTEWSECSATCGGGFRSRARNCTKPSPRHGGKNCSELGPANETQECHTHGCPPPCTGGLDIGIVLDKSMSVSSKHIRTAISFVKKLVEEFEPAPDKDHFGLITFNQKAMIEFSFKDEADDSVDELKERIDKVDLALKYQTRTDLAMKAARDMLFSLSGGDRPDKPNIMIVITDGKPTKQPKPFQEFAVEFHKDPKVADLYTVAVGVGKKINGNTLHDIAGQRGTVLAIEGFEELASSLKKVKNKVCE